MKHNMMMEELVYNLMEELEVLLQTVLMHLVNMWEEVNRRMIIKRLLRQVN